MSNTTKQEKDEAVLKVILEEVAPQLEKKFRDGMQKYAGALIDKDCLNEAMPEAMDLVIYLAAERIRKAEAARAWETTKLGLIKPPINARTVAFLDDYFSPKPLAQKIPAATAPQGLSDYEAFKNFMARYEAERILA